MAKKSDGGTGSKKVPYFKQIKELMERHGCSSPEELEALLASNATATVSVPGVAVVTADGYDPAIDPLSGFLGLDEIHLVGSEYWLPGNIQPKPLKTQPGDVVEAMKKEHTGTWGNCPFRFKGRNEAETHDLLIQNRQHHFYTLTRHYADRVAESKFGKLPAKAPITPEDFTGRDGRLMPLGNKRPTSGDNLVEFLRFCLQKFAGKLWIDFTHHQAQMRSAAFGFNGRIAVNPNPYGAKYERFGVDPRTVVPATAEGDVQKEWGNR